jgi:molybdopterin molybdotransferase
MVELTESSGAGMVRFTDNPTDDNICVRGEDLKGGQIVLHKGDKIGPQQIAVLAAVGCVRPPVFRRPKVGVIATGSELVRPDEKPQGSQIRDSNSWQICAQVERVGGIVNNYGIVPDDEEKTRTAVCKATTENDVVIVCGGVSVGEYDYVPQILKQSNFELLFEKIAVKPGKPTVFGIRNGTYCFGLPGNPASAFVIFEVLVKPFLYKLMGHDYEPRYVHAELTTHIRRKDTQRLEWIPVLTENDGTAKLIEYHGSAHIGAFCGANGLVAIDIGVAEIEKGTVVPVRLL